MPHFKPILLFLSLFIGAYIALLLAFEMEPVKKGANQFFRSSTQLVLQSTLPKAFLEVHSQKGKGANPNIARVVFGNQAEIDRQIEQARQGATGTQQVNIRVKEFKFLIYEFFIVPIFFIIALIIATPMPLKRKLIILPPGIILLLVFLYFKLHIVALDKIGSQSLGIYEYTPTFSGFLSALSGVFNIGVSIFISILVWAALSFRITDIKKWITTSS